MGYLALQFGILRK